jgi:hypothetical protein
MYAKYLVLLGRGVRNGRDTEAKDHRDQGRRSIQTEPQGIPILLLYILYSSYSLSMYKPFNDFTVTPNMSLILLRAIVSL